jgi:rhodanese-related sulfurtransferase
MRWFSAPLAQAGILLTSAGLCAVITSSLAGPARRLSWTERPAISAEPSVAPIVVPVQAPQSPLKAASVPTPIKPKADGAHPSRISSPDRFAADPAQPIRELTSADAWALFQARRPFLDARRSAEFAAGHISGAWNVSVWESDLEARITEFEAVAQPGSMTPLVLYCSGGDCKDSHLLAAKLTALGYRNLFVYQAGYPDWLQQGRPTAKGARP